MSNKLFFILVGLVAVVIAIFLFIQPADKSIHKNRIITHIPTDKCDIKNHKCDLEFNNFNVKISFDEKIFYLKPFSISVSHENKIDVKVESIQVDFKMINMNMGVNRFRLKNIGSDNNAQIWQGKALLPICVTGRADWVAEVELVTNNKTYLITIPIIVKK